MPFVTWGSGPVPTKDSSTGGGLRAESLGEGQLARRDPGKSSEAGRQAALSRQESSGSAPRPSLSERPPPALLTHPAFQPQSDSGKRSPLSLHDALGVSHLLFSRAPPSRPGARLSSKAQLLRCPPPLAPRAEGLGVSGTGPPSTPRVGGGLGSALPSPSPPCVSSLDKGPHVGRTQYLEDEVVSTSWLASTVLLQTWGCCSFFKLQVPSFPHTCPGVGPLDQMVALLLVF